MQRIQRLILMVVSALALLLASPFPRTAWASHFTLSSDPECGYSQLSAAASDATDGDTIFMTEDSSGNDCYIVQTPYQGNKKLTLDLGGHTLTVGGYKNNVADYYGIHMEIGSITIKNGTILSTSNHPDPINAVGGTIILSDDVKVESRTSVIQAANGGKVIVDGAQVVSTSAAYCAAFAKDPGSSIELRSGSISQTSTGPGLTLPPVVLSVKDGASATISGGSLYSGSSTAMVVSGVGSLITVTGGKVSNDGMNGLKSGVNGYWAGEATDGGRIYLKGGEVSSAYGNGLYALGNNSGGTIEVSGGTLSVGTTGYALLAGGSASSGSAATVSDGSLRGKVGVGVESSDAGTSSLTITGGTVDGEVTKSAGTITVSGGIFSEGLNEAYCAEGYGTVSTHNQAKPEEVRVVRSWDVTVEPIPDQTYNGSALTPKPVVKDDGSEVPDDEYELVYDDNVDVGTAKVTITHLAADGSDAMAETTFKVVARPALAKAADVTKTYGQEDPTLAATLEAVDGQAESGLVEGHVATIAVGRAEGEDVGSHQLKLENVSISDAGGRDVTANYQVDKSGLGTLSVLPRALTFTWPSDDALSYIYDGTPKTVLPTAKTVNDDEITLTCEGNSATEVGDYVARVTGFAGDKAANYVLADDEPTASQEWRIRKNPTSVTVTLEDWTYGKQPNKPQLGGSFTPDAPVTFEYCPAGGSAADDDRVFTQDVPTQAGSYIVRATVAETKYYEGGVALDEFQIVPANITIAADDKSSVVQSNLLELTYTVSGGYVQGDDLGVELTSEVFSSAGEGAAVGTYLIEVSWNGNPNYNAKVENGTYTVTPMNVDEVLVRVSAPMAGDTSASTPSATERGSGYHVGSANWCDKEGNELESTVTFAAGETYYLMVKVVADDGYAFPQGGTGTTFSAEGGQIERASVTNWTDDKGVIHSYADLIFSVEVSCPSHEPGEPVYENEVAATCEAGGSRDVVTYCSICGEELTRTHEDIPATGHNWGKWTATTPATCEDKGVETRVCQNDSSHVETRQIKALGHDWGAPTYAWSKDNGSVTAKRVCAHDKSHVELETAQATNRVITDATCTEAGVVVYEASFRNDAFKSQTKEVELPALGHDWGAWTVTTPATCDTPGVESQTCKRDASHVETRSTKALGHDWGEPVYEWAKDDMSVTATRRCTRDQNHVEWETVVATSDVTKKPTCVEEGKVTYVAQFGNEAFETQNKTSTLPVTGHNWGAWQVTKETTCKETGIETRVCANDPTHIETRELPAVAHTPAQPVSEDVHAASCTEAGSYESVVYCAVCGKELDRSYEVISPIGHDWGEGKVMLDPACTDAGIMTYVCHNDPSHLREEAIAALGHDWGEWTVSVSPTESSEGEEKRVCQNDETHFETRVIPALDHVHLLAHVEAKGPTCVAEGNIEYWVCEAGENPCGKIFADEGAQREITLADTIIPALDHTWDDGAVTVEPGCVTDGVRTYTCVVCGATKDETIEKLLHDNAWQDVVIAEPTCTSSGYHWHTLRCQRCGEAMTKVLTKDAPLGHIAGDSVRKNEVEPTCIDPGSYENVTYCERCSVELSRTHEVIEALDHEWGEWAETAAATCGTPGVERRTCMRDSCHVEERSTTALGHDWGEPTYTWSEDDKSVTAVRTCMRDESHVETETAEVTSTVVREAAETEDGLQLLAATFANPAFARQEKVVTIPATGGGDEPRPGPEDFDYAIVEGADSTWTKGSEDPVTIVVKRSLADETCFAHFTDVQIDDVTIDLRSYEAKSGSTVITFGPDFLETLSTGVYKVGILYDDGAVETTLTVNEASVDPDPTDDVPGTDKGTGEKSSDSQTTGDNKGTSGSASAVPSSGSSAGSGSSSQGSFHTATPKTGDAANPPLAFALAFAGALALVVGLLRKRDVG